MTSLESTKGKQFVVKNMRTEPKLVPLIIQKPGNSSEGLKKNSF